MKKKRILIVVSTFYDTLSKKLVESSLKAIKSEFNYKVIKVPGAFEIPVTISKHIKHYDGAIALGCVIKGETPHFEFISKASIDGIMRISIVEKKPIGNGILTCLNKKQAMNRISKGLDAAKAVLSVLS